MLLPDWAVLNSAVDWLANGLWNLSWWQVVLYTLVTTHITIAGVTIFLHRAQAHRAMDLHADPVALLPLLAVAGHGHGHQGMGGHPPQAPRQVRNAGRSAQPADARHRHRAAGAGAELYRAEAKNQETMAKFGHGTPDDWIERNLYTRFSWQGVGLMLILNVALFGVAGLAVWAVQMIWIPVTAAGIINGIGHYWGYRNFEAPDASTNISPWGLIIGGEELHNNHHTYPTSAKFSVKKYEFDIGWVYISLMKKIGWATVKKVPPKLQLGAIKPVADEKTLEALIANRYEVMAGYAREMRRVCKAEIASLKEKKADLSPLKAAKRWLHRDDERVPAAARPQLAQARAAHPVLDKMVTMREELRQLWLNTSQSREQLAADLQAWCRRAEESGIAQLQQFSMRLRAAA